MITTTVAMGCGAGTSRISRQSGQRRSIFTVAEGLRPCCPLPCRPDVDCFLDQCIQLYLCEAAHTTDAQAVLQMQVQLPPCPRWMSSGFDPLSLTLCHACPRQKTRQPAVAKTIDQTEKVPNTENEPSKIKNCVVTGGGRPLAA